MFLNRNNNNNKIINDNNAQTRISPGEWDVQKDVEIQTDHLIPARRPDSDSQQEKGTNHDSGLCHPDGPRSESQRKWEDR